MHRTLAALIAATLLSTPPLSATALTGDFGLVPVPDGWNIFRSMETSGNTLWATGTSGADNRATIFRVDLATGAFAAYPLGPEFGDDPAALSITADSAGNAWFIGAELGPGPLPAPAGDAFLGEIDSDGTLSMTALPSDVFDNNFSPEIAYDAAAGSLVWTQASGSGPAFGLGFRSAQGQIGTVGLSAPGAPRSIVVEPDGSVYFEDVSLNSVRIGKVSTAGAVSFLGQISITLVNCSNPGGTPRLIAASDGNFYFTVDNEIDQMTAGGATRTFPVLPDCAQIDSLAEGQDGRIYFGSSSAGAVGRLTPATGEVDEFALPSNYSFNLNLLVASPIALAGYDAVFASSLSGPGLLRIRTAGSSCPGVWERRLPTIVVNSGDLFFEKLGVPPDRGGEKTGFTFGITFQNHPTQFGIGGAVQIPGVYPGAATVIDSEKCTVDLFDLEVRVVGRAGASGIAPAGLATVGGR